MGFLKYLALFVLCGWMFFIGLFVGRGSAPVTFDTVSFQKRLGLIAQEHVQDQGVVAKPDFEFYEVLKEPVQTSGSSVDKSEEILPCRIKKTDGKNLTNVTPQGVPIIRSRKAMTFKPGLVAEHNRKKTKKEVTPKAKPRIKSSPEPLEKNSHRELPEDSEESLPGEDNYMIQVAAYKNLKDALEQMAILDSKGFSSYRTMGQINDTLWHRVRTGPFKNRETAKKALQKLRKENVQGIIIKKD